jgi:hypothetical protein
VMFLPARETAGLFPSPATGFHSCEEPIMNTKTEITAATLALLAGPTLAQNITSNHFIP